MSRLSGTALLTILAVCFFVDVVELAGAVVRGAAYFEEINYGILTRPNVHLRVDDGRNFMMLTRNRYDIVTADAIVPIFAGAGNLYSAEYFRLMRSVLNPGGFVVQWVWGTEAEYKAIARTFMSVFPDTTVCRATRTRNSKSFGAIRAAF